MLRHKNLHLTNVILMKPLFRRFRLSIQIRQNACEIALLDTKKYEKDTKRQK